MTALLAKLNHRGQPVVLVNVPVEAAAEVDALLAGAETTTVPAAAIDFAVVFVRTLAEVETYGGDVLRRARGDAVIWFCYPKGSSRRFSCDFNRDTGWQVLAAYGFEPVRQVSFAADWSALRFRRVAHIKNLTRRASFAITDEAKGRTTGQGR